MSEYYDDSVGGESDIVPDSIRSFVRALHRYVRNKNVYDLHNCYENEFNKLTERYYKASSWPSADAIQDFVDNDDNMLFLYKDLYFRHIYAKMQPTVDDRFDSFQNYIDLFNMILGLDTESPEIELPVQWLWDIVDEFIYQFQAFHIFRNRVKDLSAEDVAVLKEHEHIWSAQTVIRYLHALVSKGGISLSGKGANDNKDENGDKVSPLFRTLGYFALVGLLRVNVLLADFSGALKVLDPIDLRRHRNMFTQVLSCHVTLYYYMGFAYLMTRRYVDAIKIFSYFLTYVSRNKHLIPRSHNAEVINKRVEQMWGLLAIAFALCPDNIDDFIINEMKEKFGEKLTRMQKGDVSAYEEMFAPCVPKFIAPAAPNYEDLESNQYQEQFQAQLKLFEMEIKQRANIPDIYSYLKLFTTISTSKLSQFLGVDEDTVHSYLLKLKHKTRNLRWTGGAPNEGKFVQSCEVDFHLDRDMVIVNEQKSVRRYADFFIRHIQKFNDLSTQIAQPRTRRN